MSIAMDGETSLDSNEVLEYTIEQIQNRQHQAKSGYRHRDTEFTERSPRKLKETFSVSLRSAYFWLRASVADL
jgi:hypothetical protein